MNERWRALAREAELSAEHMAFGATVLGRANYAQEAYYAQAFFSLCVGFERAAKLALLLDHCVDNNGSFPSEQTVRDYHHNLKKLLSAVDDIAQRRNYEERRPTSSIIESVITILSTFATNATRYFNIDILVGKSTQNGDPVAAWNRDVTEPTLADHYYGSKVHARDKENSRQIQVMLGSATHIVHETESGEAINSPYTGALNTGKAEAARPWERMYVLQISRFLGRAVSCLGRDAQANGISDIPFFSEFFDIFNQSDRYFRERKTWSLYT